MNRRQVIARLRDAAKQAGLKFAEDELKKHTGFTVGSHRSTLGRHREIDEKTMVKFFKQYENVLGKGWWRK